ncbi:MAG: prephenate dehydratase domain-containing protein [Gemmatimonadaceae bacterium]
MSAFAGQVVVAFQGEPGAYGSVAVEQEWGQRTVALPCPRFEDVLTAVLRGAAAFGVLPVQNSIIGEIPGVAALIAGALVDVTHHLSVEVRHCLLARRGAQLDELRQVFSHPAALAQCAGFFAARPWLQACEAYDTAGAARAVSDRRQRTEAAIAHASCAERYGLEIMMQDIADRGDNVTRFAVLSPR